MQLNQIVYNHFHCPHSKESRLAVIMGTNGAGKTASMEGIKVASGTSGQKHPGF